MIDLHMHTKYSDGTDELIEILKKAEKMNLKYIAITDHNNCDAYRELFNLNQKDYYSGTIIKGIELNTKVLGIPIEILGYGINTKIMNDLAKKTYPSAKERNYIEIKRILKNCKKSNIDIPDNAIESYNGEMYTSKYIHQLLTKNENNRDLIDEDCWNNSNNFYRKYMSNPESIFYVNMDDILPDFKEAANLIRKAGGLVFIPHIYEYKDNSNKILSYILDNYKIDGIECFYTTFSKEQNETLISICKERDLFISGGSDYHGQFKPDVEMGIGFGNLCVPDKVITKWKMKVI